MDKIKHIVRVMELTGHEVLAEDYDGFIISKRDDAIMFSEPQVLAGNIEETVVVEHSRFEYETAACKWLADYDDVVDCPIVFCIAQMYVISSDRGILRHVVNWPNSKDIKCDWVIMSEEGRE